MIDNSIHPKIVQTNMYFLVNGQWFYSDLLNMCNIVPDANAKPQNGEHGMSETDLVAAGATPALAKAMAQTKVVGVGPGQSATLGIGPNGLTGAGDREEKSTIGIYASIKGFMLKYNPEWLDGLTQEQANYAIVHEMLHLVNSHKHRSIGFEKKMAEKSADQLINSHIEENYGQSQTSFQVERPTDDLPLIPPKFKDAKTLEHLYNYNIENEEEQEDENGGGGESFDQHPDDEVPQEIKEGMVQDFIEQQKARGHITNDIDSFLKKVEKAKTNYLNKIKSALSAMMGRLKKETWARFTRKNPDDNMLKGFKKYQKTLNVILDTSGSVGGDFEKLLGYIFYNGIEINLIQCDTEVKATEKVKNKSQVQKLKIKGLGGTIITPACRLVAKEYNDNPTILLTDGETDTLDLQGIKHEFMVISTRRESPIMNASCRVRQFIIGKEEAE